MEIVPLSMKEAEEFLAKHDRHYVAPAEKVCAIGVAEVTTSTLEHVEAPLLRTTTLHGAAILGRNADGDGELAHIYVDGVSQGYSLLYGAVWRAFKAMGYKKAWL